MPCLQRSICIGMVLVALGIWPMKAAAVEYTLGLYPLGSGAVGSGQLPPGGVYFTTALSASRFENAATVPFGGLTLAAKATLAPIMSGNLLAVLPEAILGGHLALSVTSGFALSTIDASASGVASLQKSVQGWGATDTVLGAAMGWQVTPEFSHKITVSQWLTTGRYGTGFFPIVGLDRPGTDLTWGATYIEPTNKIEFSGAVGFTREGFNDSTSYRSGNALHVEGSISQHFDNGFRAGVIAYQYDQITGDSGSGARLGAFETSAICVGPSFGYVAMLDGHLLSLSLQAAHEVVVHNRLRATTGTLSATYGF